MQVVLYHRQLILNTDAEFSTLHNLLVHLPSNQDFPIEELTMIADELLRRIPVNALIDIGSDDLKQVVATTRYSCCCCLFIS